MKHLLSSVALAAAALCASAPASAAIVFSFTPSATQIAVGGNVTIDATISGLGADILSGFDLNFIYNAAILGLDPLTDISYVGETQLGPVLGTLGLAISPVAGNLGLDDASFDDDATVAANQDDSFVLFRFTMAGLADGATTFTLGAPPDFDRNFAGLADQSGNPASLNVDVGSICIAVGTGSCAVAVPEPASYGLAAIALLAAGAAGRTRRRREVI